MSDKKDPKKSPRDTNGPVVKTGPTAGQNRSRNDDGTWHKKRSDAGEPKKKSGCFITTAVCSYKGYSDDCLELQVLRRFRDEYMLGSEEGAQLVKHYYHVAPAIADALVQPADLEYSWQVVRNCVELIQNGQYQEALHAYTSMVDNLQRKLGAAQ